MKHVLNTAVVGVGFIGEAHIEAVRRTCLGQVELVVGLEGDQIRQKAEALRVPRWTVRFEDVLEDSSIDIVHICTPNSLHYAMAKAALEAGKHVVCEKPMTMTAEEARTLAALAERSGLVNAIHFNVRYYPLVRHARELIHTGAMGRVLAVTGSYLQDWLIKDTDYSWRLESEQSGDTRAVGDIGTHWMDLLEYVTGRSIHRVNADMETFLKLRKKPKGSVETWSGKVLENKDYDQVPVDTEDYASVLLHFSDGARGVFTVNQMAAGRKNRVYFEINCLEGSLVWDSEAPNQLLIGRRDSGNEILIRDPSLVCPSARDIITLPGGHNEGFADTSKQLFREVYARALGTSEGAPTYPTFRDGLRESLLCEAVVKSARTGQWTEVD